MNRNGVTSREFFLTIRLVPAAFITSVILFLILTIFVIIPEMDITFEGAEAIVLIGIGILAIPASFIAGMMAMKYRLGLIDQDTPLSRKCPEYRTGNIIKFAIFEGAGLYAVIAYILTQHPVMLGVALLMILVMVLHFPTRDRMINALALGQEEIALLNDPDAIISRI
ncbi:MAG: hypothetical protein EA363_05605 [Balneolaceae bacterium]|nr:MAG: hypothetical protein EA363_05605 [Balneolaceae bacterium]